MRVHAFALAGLTLMAAAALFLTSLGRQLQPVDWLTALLSPDPTNIDQLLVHHTLMSRAAAAILAGAALGLSGAVLQILLGNPLAEPGTLGISAGAQLALASAAAYWGVGTFWSQSAIALAGGGTAIAIVLGLSWRSGLAPAQLIMSGLVLSFGASALVSLITILDHEYLRSLFIWSTGSLRQNDWSAPARLAPTLLIGALLIALLARALDVAALGESPARNLGLPMRTIRLSALAVAAALAAFTTAAVGAIGFVGLAAPHLARLTGARRTAERLIWAPVFGAGLLWLTDEGVKLLSTTLPVEVATGSATALLGSPLLLWLAPHLKARPVAASPDPSRRVSGGQVWKLLSVGLVLAGTFLLCGSLSAGPHGWLVNGPAGWPEFAAWQGPRVLASAAAGALLGVGGVMLQRLTGNRMAAPDVIGINAGAAFGFLLVLYVSPFAAPQIQVAVGSLTAGLTGLVLLKRAAMAAQPPEQVLIVGIALSALLSALVAFLMATGDPHMMLAFIWLSGSTYRVTGEAAAWLAAIALAGIAASFGLRRWLAILPLGQAVATGSGIPLLAARMLVILVVSIATAAATLVIGPLSFVGLVAPELARRMCLRGAGPSLAGGAMIGAAILLIADWAGRNIMFPYEIPSGLAAIIVGSAFFMWFARLR